MHAALICLVQLEDDSIFFILFWRTAFHSLSVPYRSASPAKIFRSSAGHQN
jgi:hypothetical protein